MDRVHTYCMTEQISCTLTTMAMSAFVPYRFCVFFLYQTNKQVHYWIVIILVETIQWFEVSSKNLIQFCQLLLVEHGNTSNKLYLYPCPSIYGPVAVIPQQGVAQGNNCLLSITRNIGGSAFIIY